MQFPDALYHVISRGNFATLIAKALNYRDSNGFSHVVKRFRNGPKRIQAAIREIEALLT